MKIANEMSVLREKLEIILVCNKCYNNLRGELKAGNYLYVEQCRACLRQEYEKGKREKEAI
ncbi:hypothetical protein DRO91_08795 [Candidatus Heimdallarchaeota archaeon]|nr:MAG: hypothetical protein DRO91_08795 [Candidatus Heimdallarchaeota archaeon]